jgi:uncharacterized protein YndB with AHSA1/START domain
MTRTLNEREPIVVEQAFGASIERVWKAITDPEQMRQWYFESIEEFRPEPGFETRFNVRNEGRDYPHLWRVTEVIPNRRIAYEWQYPGFPGDSAVVWELAETGSGTRLRLTHSGVETFPQEDPAFSRESCQAGWQYFLGNRLKAFIDKQQP